MKSIKVSLYKLFTIFALTMPLFVHAQNIDVLLYSIGRWVNNIAPILSGIALLVFFWGLVKFIFHAGDEEKRSEGKKFMMWAIIGIFVLVSIWGIIFFLSRSFGTGLGGSAPTPCFGGLPGCRIFGRPF